MNAAAGFVPSPGGNSIDAKQVMAHLEKKGTAQARKIYARHGYPEPMFGVSFAELTALKKKLKKDQALADALWSSGNADARILAAMVADPAAFDAPKARKWVKETDFRGLADYVAGVVARSPRGLELAGAFIASKDPKERMAGLTMLAQFGKDGTAVPPALSRRALEQIERTIHTADNWSRYGMMFALIGIGGYNEALRGEAIAAAKRIGNVDFDPGETNCKMPDPVPYIEKMAARASKKRRTTA